MDDLSALGLRHVGFLDDREDDRVHGAKYAENSREMVVKVRKLFSVVGAKPQVFELLVMGNMWITFSFFGPLKETGRKWSTYINLCSIEN